MVNGWLVGFRVLASEVGGLGENVSMICDGPEQEHEGTGNIRRVVNGLVGLVGFVSLSAFLFFSLPSLGTMGAGVPGEAPISPKKWR